MVQTAHINLADGRRVDFTIRTSAKSRSVRLKLNAREGLLVTVPNGVSVDSAIKLVANRSDWIEQRLAQFDEVRHLLSTSSPVRPQAFDLPALGEAWRVEYLETCARTVGAKTDRPGRIVVSGAIGNESACQAALRRWLARRAKETLGPWLERTSHEIGLRFSDVALKSQRTRWGSCTREGRISLNCKLLFLPRDLVRYVLVHELCHLLEPNHSGRFWAHLRQFEPAMDSLHGRMRDAWKFVPAWAQRGHGTTL